MKPVSFPQQNIVIAENQKEYLPLPAYKESGTDEGQLITCWKFSFFERVKILFTGKLWMNELTFHKPVTPRQFSLNRWTFLNKEFFKNQKHEK